MNEVMQKIMNESFTDEQGERFDPERFAELIVRECSGVALNIGCGDIENELLKHFGVKE
jgi:hypothetical protein